MPITTQRKPEQAEARYRLLAPAAYSETAIPSLRLTRSSRTAHRIGRLLLATIVLSLVAVVFAPWQQSVKGSGNVIAYAPQERQQVLETPIKGRIVSLGEGIVENGHVSKGQLIARVSDVDPLFLGRLEESLAAARSQVEAARALMTASEKNKRTLETVVTSFESQVVAYQAVREQIIAAADAAIESAKNKVAAENQQLIEHEAALAQVEANYKRQQTLYNDQIVSQLKFQEAERKYKEYQAKVAKSRAYVAAAENDLLGKRSERLAKEQKANVDIDYASASFRKARGDVAKAESEVAKAQSEFNKAQKLLLDTQTKVARQQNQTIVAPFDGFVTQIRPNNGSRILKEGDAICTIVPDTADRAVQIWLDGNDAPLVQPGRHVRLQFEGWPAVQFAGWPSVAVGTFGGRVISVDATDDGKGKFRILVLPDKEDAKWPNKRFLRQGVRSNGWVLLDEVPLWYEIWRNMNGFPPVVSTSEPKDNEKKSKRRKL